MISTSNNILADSRLFEITGHARGGQGMVTAFEILAKIFSDSGEYEVQAFPSFGVERTGAPIQAYLRISKSPILNRSNIYFPNLIVVFDESLLGQIPVFKGLKENGIILVNTEKDPSSFKGDASIIYTIPATKISLKKGLGSKSLPIVNSAMIGALIKILNGDISMAGEIIRKEVPAKHKENVEAAGLAYEQANLFLNKDFSFLEGSPEIKPALNTPSTPFWSKPMSLNKTGNWRLFTPSYVTREAPCSTNCPAGTDVRAFVKLASEKKFEKAYDVIFQNNPFPSVCGRVCPHFCQQNCNRAEMDGQLNIGAIERFIGDKRKKQKAKPSKIVFKEKIAVIGSGPAGLTVALRLRQLGYKVTVFESMAKPGGMMRKGIPEFRLPESTLDREIKNIKEKGVEIVLNKKVSVEEISKNFSAVISAVGSHVGTKMRIENEDSALDGIFFLNEVKLNNNRKLVKRKDRVAVIGGGNTAIDVARTILRLGGIPTIYYRRTKNEMPAIAHEVEEALAEGVKIEFLSAPVKIEKSKSGLRISMVKMKLGEPDSKGRKQPVPVKGSEKNIIVEKIIKATGQTFDEYVFGNANSISPKQGHMDYHGETPLFCCGDMAWGGTVVEAIGSGNEAAKEVHAFLRNETYQKKKINADVVTASEINVNYYLPVPGNKNPVKKIHNFLNDFSEVVGGLAEEKITEESGRCLHCGDCFSCGNCFNYCPDAAISIDDENRMRIDYDYCKGCGLCFHECPCSAIKFEAKSEAVS